MKEIYGIIIIGILLIMTIIFYSKLDKLSFDIAELKEIVSEQPEMAILDIGARTDQVGEIIITE